MPAKPSAPTEGSGDIELFQLLISVPHLEQLTSTAPAAVAAAAVVAAAVVLPPFGLALQSRQEGSVNSPAQTMSGDRLSGGGSGANSDDAELVEVLPDDGAGRRQGL